MAYIHITIVKGMFKYIYVFKILRQAVVEQSEGGNIHKIITLMEVKNQKHVFKFFISTSNHYFYSKK